MPDQSPADGVLTLTRSPRGRLLHARLDPEAIPRHRPAGAIAPQIFELSDAVFGTTFGELTPPFGIAPIAVPPPRSIRYSRHEATR